MDKMTYTRYMIVEKVTGRVLMVASMTNEFTDDLTLAEIWESEDRAEDYLHNRYLEEYCEVVKVQVIYEEIE